ncbi:MAG TPA: PhoH family protein [Actinomycetes bacterium]|jgi:PhoH-like ATPase|nr:PhoH family protein [Actinomycetes bacterium]
MPRLRTYVLDTNVLIADPEAPGRFEEHDVVIPLTVVEELDKLKTRPDETGASARRAIRALEALREQGNLSVGVALPGGGRLWVEVNHAGRLILPEGLSADSDDNRILATTANLAKELGDERGVVLVSKDASLRIKAEALKLAAEEYRHERVAIEEGYLGVATVEVAGGLDKLYASRGGSVAADQPLWANQFVVLRSGSQSALGQVQRTAAPGEPAEVVLVGEAPETFGVRARSKEQHFALHLLRDPKVPLVSLAGNAGTGKTYLAVAAGLEVTVEAAAYDRVLVFRPVVPVGRQDLGFLPGDVDEKISPWMKAIHDTLAQLFRGSHDTDRRESYTHDLVQGLLDDGTVQLEPLTFIRGRTFVRTFAILDEAQNVEYGVLRSLASRLGEGSKLVMCHDTTQVDHPYVEPDSGVAALIERLKGEALFGHVTLLKGERSPVAELVARKL